MIQPVNDDRLDFVLTFCHVWLTIQPETIVSAVFTIKQKGC